MPRDELPGGDERVLVVDDNRVLAESTRRLLAELGYEAQACGDPLHARKLVEASPQGCFRLLLTDYEMPHMTGLQLAKALRQFDPDLRVILCSAWPQETLRKDHPEEQWPAFLEKPFSLETLARRVRDILDSHVLAMS